MSEVVYSDLRFQHPSQQQNNQELETRKKNAPSDCVNEVNQNSFNAEGHPANISYNKEANKTEWKYPTCSKDWHQLGQNCYHFSKSKYLWKECDGYCTNLMSTFIKVDTTDEMDFLLKLVKMQSSQE
ncbi:oxidized low-density lipoprotein receptor 1-like [Talpa occidentalis]|uniref:oxidized low-density lipoprotein receptor 1-like n=1 Tax=Talpa occidentalis TaxID=50954 RepID=UPI0023FA4161|nr:oxidized low-density lipoprotein receptor 1-like [Talpa occidentalis]